MVSRVVIVIAAIVVITALVGLMMIMTNQSTPRSGNGAIVSTGTNTTNISSTTNASTGLQTSPGGEEQMGRNNTYLGSAVIGVALCLTGPWSSAVTDAVFGPVDYILYVANASGNIGYSGGYGVFYTSKGYYTLRIVIEDNKFDPQTTIRIINKWHQAYGDALKFVIICGDSQVLNAVYPLAVKYNFYMTGSIADSYFASNKYEHYLFPATGSHEDQYGAFLVWFRDNWNGARKPRVAILYDPVSTGTYVGPTMARFAEYLGYDVHTEILNPGSTTAVPQMSAIVSFKPDVLLVMTDPTDTFLVLNTAQGLRLSNTSIVLYYYVGMFEPFIRASAPVIEALMGMGSRVYVTGSTVPIGYPVPGMKDILSAIKAAHRGNVSSLYVYGWVSVMISLNIINKAIDIVGNLLNTSAVVDVIYGGYIRNLSTGGLTPPITLSREDRVGTHRIWIWQIVPSKPVPYINITAVDMTPYQSMINGILRELFGN